MPEQTASAHLILAFAEPLVLASDAVPLSIPRLDLIGEQQNLFESLAEAGRAVIVRRVWASTENLRIALTRGTRLLHFSGHGEAGNLLLEDGAGGTHVVAAQELKNLLTAGDTSVELVFASACESEAVGSAFAEAGVPHVIAVRRDAPVLDLAARVFARHFYLALFAGKTVREAFEIAREAVVLHPEVDNGIVEGDKFLLMPSSGDHDVILIDQLPEGSWVDLSPPDPVSNLPTAPEYMAGRHTEIWQAIQGLRTGRILTLRGTAGIGKTTIAEEVARYLSRRGVCPDGCFIVSLSGITTRNEWAATIALQLNVPFQREADLLQHLRSRALLLILDDAEDPLNGDPRAFRSFVQSLIDQAPTLRLLLASRQALGGALRGVAERVVPVGPLPPLEAAALFLQLAPRPLSSAETGGKIDLAALSTRPLLKFLSGHPHAIALAAPQLADRSLIDLERLFHEHSVAGLAVPGLSPSEEDASTNWVVSLELSIEAVRKHAPEALSLLGLFSLLPGGAFLADLHNLWGADFRPLLDVLVRRSLVERSQIQTLEYFHTLPLITLYAQRLLSSDTQADLISRVTKYFATVLEDMHRTSFTFGRRLRFALQHENYWSCLERGWVLKDDGWPMGPTTILALFLSQLLTLGDHYPTAAHAAVVGLELCRQHGDRLGEAKLLTALANARFMAGQLGGGQGYFEEARVSLEGALTIYEDIPEPEGKGEAHRQLGSVLAKLGDPGGAQQQYTQAETVYAVANILPGIANCQTGQGELSLDAGDLDGAAKHFLSALQLNCRLGEPYGAAACLGYLARTAFASGAHERAVVISQEALLLHRRLGDRLSQALDLTAQARSLCESQEYVGAVAAGLLALTIFNQIAGRPPQDLVTFLEGAAQMLPTIMDQLGPLKVPQVERLRARSVDAVAVRASPDPLLPSIRASLRTLTHEYAENTGEREQAI